jgi:hypothetical protein
MKMLGFDFNGGRLDVSAHPFCGGVPEDVRITTRYDEDELLSALFGVIHETGHARYEQNLPRAWAGQPIAWRAQPRSMNHRACSLKCSWGAVKPSSNISPCGTRPLWQPGGVQRRELYCLEPAREAGLYPRRCGRSELPGTWCCAMRLSAR